MKKTLISLLLALMLVCFSSAVMAEETTTASVPDMSIVMNLVDETSGRAVLTLVESMSGDITASVEWADSADVNTVWSWTSSDDVAAGTSDLPYNNATCIRYTYGESGVTSSEVLFTDGTGKLILTDNGFAWQDDQTEASKDCNFVMDPEGISMVLKYMDIVSQRASMDMSMPLSMDRVDIEISWSEGAASTRVWRMTCALDLEDASAPMTYTDAISQRIVTDENGHESVETLYTDGTGSFIAYEAENAEQGYEWKPDNEDITCSFEPVLIEIDIPAVDENTEDTENATGAIQPMTLYIESVGTMDDTEEPVYCIDAFEADLDMSGDDIKVTYTSDNWKRLLLSGDLIALLPSDISNPVNSEMLELDSAEAFSDWWLSTFNGKTVEEVCPGLYFDAIVDPNENVTVLMSWYIEP